MLLAIVLVLSACGSVEDAPLVPRDGSPTRVRSTDVAPEVLLAAASLWRPLVVNYTIDGSTPVEVDVAISSAPFSNGLDGVFLYPSMQIYLRYSEPTLLAHELGHALGLQHVSGCGVMSPIVCSTTLTQADLDEFNRSLR